MKPSDIEILRTAATLTSIPLRKLNEQHELVDSASGCLIDYFGHRLLLTVSHRGLSSGNWAMEVEFDQEKGTKLHQLGGLNYIARIDLARKTHEQIDFAYALVPREIVSLYQEIGPGGYIKRTLPQFVFDETLENAPCSEEYYHFAGQTNSRMKIGFFALRFRSYLG